MIKLAIALLFILVGLAIVYWLTLMKTDQTIIEKPSIPENAAVATLAGGCFWCVEAAYEGGMPGVYEAVSGYTGGQASDASYRLIAQGNTGHVEAVQIYYDPTVVSYEELLTIFWQQIDPTDDGGQFADRGSQYRTAIFYHNDTQKTLAEASKKALEQSGKFENPIVTQVLPAKPFYPAEENHQDFARKKSGYYQAYKVGSGRAGFIDRVWEE